LSLRLRLSLGITAVLVVFFAGVGVVEYRVLHRAFVREIDYTLGMRGNVLVHEVLAAAANGRLVDFSQVHLDAAPFQGASPNVYAEVCGADGQVLLRSRNLAGNALPVPQPLPTEQTVHTVRLGGEEVRVLTTPIVDAQRRQVGSLVLGSSLEVMDAAVLRATQVLILTRAVELALTLAVTLLLLSRGLAPLRRVAETAERIIASGDVSQRVETDRAEDEVGRIATSFNEVVAKIESLLLAQKRLLADTSHELRNPLTVVRTNVDFLAKDLDAATRQEVAEETEREIRRMIALVEDLMALSKAESTQPVRMEPVRLDRLAREAVERLLPLAGGRAIDLLESEARPVVRGDEDRLRQVLINLITNAIRYTDPGGRIEVGVERRDGNGVVVVRDNGIGIAAEHLPHLFDRFYRVDSARSRSTGGSGLGLAIVKAIVDAHGGRVEVESRVGEGSAFRVRIPLEETEKPRITNLMPVVKE
jgi:heavy metal sensor kinase